MLLFEEVQHNCKIYYISQQYSQDTANAFTYEFIATNDGIAVCQDTGPTLKSYLYEADESSLSSSRLSGLAIAYNGESIT